MSVNRVILVGHLGADPEVRVTPGGLQVANLRFNPRACVRRDMAKAIYLSAI